MSTALLCRPKRLRGNVRSDSTSSRVQKCVFQVIENSQSRLVKRLPRFCWFLDPNLGLRHLNADETDRKLNTTPLSPKQNTAMTPKKSPAKIDRITYPVRSISHPPHLAQILRDEQRSAGRVQRSQRQRPHRRVVGQQVDQGEGEVPAPDARPGGRARVAADRPREPHRETEPQQGGYRVLRAVL